MEDGWPWQDQPPREHDPHAQDGSAAVEQRDLDGEAQPECVDRSGPLKEQDTAPRERLASDEATHPLAARLWHVGGQTLPPGRHDQRDRSHTATLAGRSDMPAWVPLWGGQDSNPRHEG